MVPEIEQFAKILVENVRDSAIHSSDIALRPNAVSPVAKRWAKAALNESSMDFAATVIPDVVDETVFYLLNAID